MITRHGIAYIGGGNLRLFANKQSKGDRRFRRSTP